MADDTFVVPYSDFKQAIAQRELNEGNTMKIYITKYALTQGIFTQEATEVNVHGMATVPRKRGSLVNMDELYHRGEWFRTRKEAVADVQKKITRKRESIRKQLAKLDALEAKLKKKQ